MRESRSFSSTFEDDESEVLSDSQEYYDDIRYLGRGRDNLQDLTRSRSHSLATTSRPAPIGSYSNPTFVEPGTSWSRTSGPLNIPGNGGGRYGDINPPGSRYGSLGTMGRSPVNIHASSPTGLHVGNGFHRQQVGEISNISPFVRDVNTILLDDGSALRELWGTNMPSEGGTASGTTSRRHSVSIVQPRRGVVGFNAPDSQDELVAPQSHSSRNGSGLMFTDDDLAADLGLLNLNVPQSKPSLPVSQPSSLPIYAPVSRNAASGSNDTSYQENLSIPGRGDMYPNRNVHSPSESGYSGGSSSPPRMSDSGFDSGTYGVSGGFASRIRPELKTDFGQHAHQAGARFLPSPVMQHIPEGQVSPTYTRAGQSAASYMQTNVTSPLSPTSARSIHAPQVQRHVQQQQQHPHQLHQFPMQSQMQAQVQMRNAPPPIMHRRGSSSEGLPPQVADLGKGVPLHAVPLTCPLYIVEFKAGRTDLFYGTDPTLDIRIGDLVIVEADRGQDLGKVVNDTITLQEVEAFQRQQSLNSAGYGGDHGYGGPASPDGPNSHPSGKRDINPKRIYGKAQPHDTQLVSLITAIEWRIADFSALTLLLRMLLTKIQDEVKALQLCQTKVRQKKLPMEVIDAEYQWYVTVLLHRRCGWPIRRMFTVVLQGS